MPLRLFIATLLLTTASATAAPPSQAQSRSHPVRPYTADWSSLRRHPIPQWLDEMKFGIYCHWGPQSVQLASDNPNLSRIEAIREWRGEKFSAAAWTELFTRAGAQCTGIVAWHGSGLLNWDSHITQWTSVHKGPRVDIVGELTREARARGMKVLTTFHSTDIWGRVSPDDPTELPAAERGQTKPERASEQTHRGWLARVSEAIDRYRPDAIWFDTHFGGTVPAELRGRASEGRLLQGQDNLVAGMQERGQQQIIAHYFNRAQEWSKEVGFITKSFDVPPGVGMRDIEDGNLTGLQYDPWMADINMPLVTDYRSSWFYNPKNRMKSADLLVDLLVDITSKNGRMLLNVPPHADGSFPPEVRQRLEAIGDWLKINGEAIYGTSPWVFFGEGPTAVTRPGHHGHSKNSAKDIAHYSEQDVRFTQNGRFLYAICLGWPGEELRVRLLGGRGKLYPGDIKSIALLGSEQPLDWEQTPEALVVRFPKDKPCHFAYCLKIER